MKNTNKPPGTTRFKGLKEVACNDCGMYNLCKLAGLEADETTLDSIVERRKSIANTNYLYRAGERFRGVFAVKSGLFKSISLFEDGCQQITAFHLPGELIGLEAIEEGVYLQSVVAVENSSVCDMDFTAMAKQKNSFSDFQYSVIQALSRKVRLDQHQSLLFGAHRAEQRLAIFIISIFSRLQAHEMQSESFNMPTRKDIANYLGLAMETVCRILKSLDESKLIEKRGRRIKLCNYSGLQKYTGLVQYGANSG